MPREFVAVERTETAPLEDGAVIFHAESGKFIVLNRSATLLWNELTAPADADELARKLRAKYDAVPEDVALQDTAEVLERLRDLGLVRVTGE